MYNKRCWLFAVKGFYVLWCNIITVAMVRLLKEAFNFLTDRDFTSTRDDKSVNFYKPTQRNISEDSPLPPSRRENLRPHVLSATMN
jgi:hypothetical protein